MFKNILRIAVQCGHDELKTTGYRFRAHKSDGAACPLLTRLGARSCDRDGDTKGVATGPSGPSVGVAQHGVVTCKLCARWPVVRGQRTFAGANACVATEEDVFLVGQD